MKKLTCLLLIIFTQNVAFAESFGIFKSRWNKVPVNQSVTASYDVEESMPTADKEKLDKLIQQYDRTGTSWRNHTLRNDIESEIEDILHKYNLNEYARSEEKKREIWIKAMNSPVRIQKSAQVHIRSLSLKHVGSEYLEWKDAFKGEKTHYCAIKVDANWQGVPSQVDDVSFGIRFFDSDGLRIYAEGYVRASRDNMASEITLYADRAYGKPVRFKINLPHLPNAL